MGFRFWRRVKIAPGLTLNLSKSGGSLSVGPRGGKVTMGSRGKRATVGLPGTGMFYTTTFSKGRTRGGNKTVAQPEVLPEDRLTLGFFQRLITPDDEKALVDGFRELSRGNELRALEYLKRAAGHADGAFIAGFIALKRGRIRDARRYLCAAASNHRRLGRIFAKYDISPVLVLPVTGEISACVGPDLRGVLLGLVEVYQHLEQWKDAMACLEKLRRLEPNDVLVKLSLAELMLDARPDHKKICQRVVRLAEGVENDSELHAALLLYKARALRTLGLKDAARNTLTATLRKTRDRSDTLLHALRYERALIYEELGQKKRAQKDFERLYTDAPGYEDVAARLGL